MLKKKKKNWKSNKTIRINKRKVKIKEINFSLCKWAFWEWPVSMDGNKIFGPWFWALVAGSGRNTKVGC